MQVRDLLKLETLSGLRVLAGEDGTERRVASVSVMDAPDICDWMRGGEFLITSGYTIKTHPVELETLVSNLDRADVAALGIKVDRFINRVPDGVLETANRLHFPIIHIPNKHAFVDIINPVLAEIVNQQARELLYSEEIHNAFLDLALGGRSIQEVVDTLSRIIDKDVVFKDHVFHHTYLSPGAEAGRLAAETTVRHAVATAARRYGCVYVLNATDRHTGKYERIAVEHANTILILLLQKELSNRQIEYRYRSELIHDILTRNYRSLEEVQARAALYGWRFRGGMRVVISDIDDFKLGYLKRSQSDRPLEWIHEPMIQIIRSHLRARFRCYYTHYSDTIVFLVEHGLVEESRFKADLAAINDEIIAAVEAETGYTFTIGVGDRKVGVEAAPVSYEEAKLAVRIGRQRGESGRTVFYSDLGIYRLLHDIHDVLERQNLFEETLAPLIEYDRQHDTGFYETLAKAVELDWNLQGTSEALHIHYNTAKYRLKRTEEILGLDLSAYETKLKIGLAVCWKAMVRG